MQNIKTVITRICERHFVFAMREDGAGDVQECNIVRA